MVRLRKRMTDSSRGRRPQIPEPSALDLGEEITLVDEVTELRDMLLELSGQMSRLDKEREEDRKEMKAMLEKLTLSVNVGPTASSQESQGATASSPVNVSPSTGAIARRMEHRSAERDLSPPVLTLVTPPLRHIQSEQQSAGPSRTSPQVAPRRLFTPPAQPATAPHVALQPTYVIVSDRDNITKFKAEAPASQPLRRNQEVEGWIRQLENAVKPATDEALIRAARSRCGGQADIIINSPIFDDIRTWAEFRQKIRQKFRGTCSASDFFTLLYEVRMMAGQAPLDFHTTLEGMVYQGYRDHREAVGNPEELIRRVFLQGLPGWL